MERAQSITLEPANEGSAGASPPCSANSFVGRIWAAIAACDYVLGIVIVSCVLTGSMIYWVDRLPHRRSDDYNEGWNALLSKRLFEGKSLYPGKAAMVVNNYPPLSFYIVGVFGKLLNDNIIAGRLISLAAFAAITFVVGLIVWSASKHRGAAIFAGTFFAATMAVLPGGRIGLNDPQMLGHAVMSAAFAVLCMSRRTLTGIAIVAACVTAALFIKHNLIALPLAITVWLFLEDMRKCAAWIACMAVAVAVGAILVFGLHGTGFIDGVLMKREVSPLRLAKQTQAWLLLVEIPLITWFSFSVVRPSGRLWGLVSLYVIFAILEIVLFAGGAGVGINVIFDLVIGVSIAAGLAIASLDGQPRTRAAVIAALCTFLVLRMPSTPMAILMGSYESPARQAQAAEKDIAYVAAHPGPVICENLGLCYWAGKNLDYDPFTMRQSFMAGRRSEKEFLATLASKPYAIIQLDTDAEDRDDTRFSAAFMATLKKYYNRERRSSLGSFFTPKP